MGHDPVRRIVDVSDKRLAWLLQDFKLTREQISVHEMGFATGQAPLNEINGPTSLDNLNVGLSCRLLISCHLVFPLMRVSQSTASPFRSRRLIELPPMFKDPARYRAQ